MAYRLIAVDLDGTLLNSAGRLSQRTADVLRKLVRNGVVIAPATARWYQAAIQPFAPLGLSTPAISACGADVRAQDGRVLLQTPLPRAFTAFIADLADRAGWIATLSTPSGAFRRSNELPPWAAHAPGWLKPVTSLAGADLEGLLSVLVELGDSGDELAGLAAWDEQIAVRTARAFNGNRLVSVTARAADKGAGLRALCAALDIELRDTVAIGDDEVDLPMFEVAGLSIAMGNAGATVRAAADMVTGSADEDGVATALQGL